MFCDMELDLNEYLNSWKKRVRAGLAFNTHQQEKFEFVHFFVIFKKTNSFMKMFSFLKLFALTAFP